MRRARGTRELRIHVSLALEELVRTVAALDGPRAAALLCGLSEALRPAALELLHRVERSSRADRHVGLASAFAPRPAARASAQGIPGLVGAEVRKRLAPGGARSSVSRSEPLARWARRLVIELDPP